LLLSQFEEYHIEIILVHSFHTAAKQLLLILPIPCGAEVEEVVLGEELRLVIAVEYTCHFSAALRNEVVPNVKVPQVRVVLDSLRYHGDALLLAVAQAVVG
jgi:hypothetical protein